MGAHVKIYLRRFGVYHPDRALSIYRSLIGKSFSRISGGNTNPVSGLAERIAKFNSPINARFVSAANAPLLRARVNTTYVRNTIARIIDDITINYDLVSSIAP